MSRTTNKPGLPDLDVVHEVIRLDDALLAAMRRSGPGGSLRGDWSPERTALFDYLSALPDVRMAELHALFWLGCRPSSTPRAYEWLYEHALENLDHGAGYLTGRPLEEDLRRGLAKLGLPVPSRAQTTCSP
jgi:hypothetical protein